MTDKFTIERIKSSWEICFSPSYTEGMWQKFIAELTRPQWKPEEGEVYYHSSPGGIVPQYSVYCADVGRGITQHSRALTPDEVPALKVAIEILKNIAKWRPSSKLEVPNINAGFALAEIAKLTGEDME